MSVKHGLLALLDRQSMHGYELRRELIDELGPEWAINYGQIYATLQRLVRDGLVVQSETVPSKDAPDRKLYTVTPAGRSHLRQWFLTPIDGFEAGRDELFAKILLGLTGAVEIGQVIQVERKAQLRRIGQLTSLKEQLDSQLELPSVLHLDLSIMKIEAAIRWLDAAESRVHKTASDGVGGVVPSTHPRPPLLDETTPSEKRAEERERS